MSGTISGKKVLVTGAEGFIGSHLTERLVADGAEVSAFVLYNSFDACGWLDTLAPEIRREVKILRGDVRDPNSVDRAVRNQETIFHLAALISIPYSYEAPASYVETNITGTLNVLQSALRHGSRRVLHTSTSEVYGTAQRVPIDETHPLNAQSPYAASKVGADQLAISMFRSVGAPVAVVRPFNTYGPRQSTRAIIPTIITQALSGAPEIKLGSLHPTRDLSYAADTASGFVRAALTDGIEGQVFNLGSDFEISVGDLAKEILDIIGVHIPVVTRDERLRPALSEVERLWADTTRAKEILKFQPQFGGRDGLRRGLEATIAWFSDPENLKRFPVDRYSM